VWGDAVSTACLMESHGVAGRVQLSESTWLKLREPFAIEERGILDLKGKGRMKTWFLAGRSADIVTLAAA
jgi:class 3 adenylate cyclase